MTDKEVTVKQDASKSLLTQSVIKALQILEYINKNGEKGIREISEALDFDKSTVHRLIVTLKQQKYLQQNLSNNRYSCTLKLFQMGMMFTENLGINRQIKGFLEELATKTGESVNLGILDETDVVHIEKVENKEIIKVDMGIGAKIPSYATALGKSILAFLSEESLQNLFECVILHPQTPNTHTSFVNLYKDLQDIKRKGYATDKEEYSLGLSCIAVPIQCGMGKYFAAISVAFPTYRFPKTAVEENRIVQNLLRTAEKISLVFRNGGLNVLQ